MGSPIEQAALISRTGIMIGSRAWMSPQIIAGEIILEFVVSVYKDCIVRPGNGNLSFLHSQLGTLQSGRSRQVSSLQPGHLVHRGQSTDTATTFTNFTTSAGYFCDVRSAHASDIPCNQAPLQSEPWRLVSEMAAAGPATDRVLLDISAATDPGAMIAPAPLSRS